MFSNTAYSEISISNDNVLTICDDISLLIAAQDMFTTEDAAKILRECEHYDSGFAI